MEVDLVALSVYLVSLLLVTFTVLSEQAMTAANRGELRQLGADGNGQATAIDNMLRDPANMLITSLILKTAGLMVAGATSVLLLVNGSNWGQQLVLLLVTWLAFVAIQGASRSWVMRRPMEIALWVAPLMRLFVYILWPIVAILRRYAGDAQQDDSDEALYLSDQGLRLLIGVADEEESIPETEKQMIASILEMNETVAREVMVPRIDVVSVEGDTPFREALDVVIAAGHSRIPVYEDNIDHVIGFLYAKDLLSSFQTGKTNQPICDLLRPAYFVPGSKKLNALLHEMQKHRVHIAMVVDEYGGTAGLVTIEDIIEEIVGDIQDEYDLQEETLVQAIGANAYILSAKFDLYSVAKLLEIEVPEGDADTLGGMIYSILGHVPEQGESLQIGEWQLTVLSLDGRRIEQVRAELLNQENSEDYQSEIMHNDSPVSERSALNYSVSD